MTDETTDHEKSHEDQLEIALALVYDAIQVNNDGLRSNPSKEEKRKLIKRRARLEAERADLEGILDALADGESIDVEPPTIDQVKAIADLTAEVERQRRASLTAGEALALTGQVLELAMDLTGG